MKQEDWDSYQAQEPAPDAAQPQSSTHPRAHSPYYQVPPQAKSSRLSWPMAFLLLGLAIIGGICYAFTHVFESLLVAADTSEPSVGVLVLENEILGSVWTTTTLDEFQKDDNIKSVVVRINSPGGSVAPCQEIYHALRSFNKPVVISMGSVAASGGLYVAAGGDLVLANPGTITGSIGVIMQSIEVAETFEKVGLKSVTIKSGPYKDLGSPFRAMKEEERQILDSMVMEVYEQFVDDLIAGRSKMDAAVLRKIADGRIFSGAEALELGLIDELGGFEDALRRAAKMGGLDDSERPTLIIEDGREPWWQVAMSSKAGNLQLELPPTLKPGFSLKYIYQPSL